MDKNDKEKLNNHSISVLKAILFVVFTGITSGILIVYHIRFDNIDTPIIKFINEWEMSIVFFIMASILYIFADVLLYLGWRIYPFHWFGLKYNVRTFKISGIILFVIDIIIFLVTLFKI